MNLNEYCAERGRQANLCKRTGAHPPDISKWASGGRPMPVEWAPLIERETDGAVTVEECNTGATWIRVPDAAWPWHPEGKPLVDVLPELAADTDVKAGA